MSAGNLYRYFPSKEAIVEGLCALDQEGRTVAMAALFAKRDDVVKAMRESFRDHVLAKPPEKARMIVEIWAEAGRNARVQEMLRVDGRPGARRRSSGCSRRPRRPAPPRRRSTRSLARGSCSPMWPAFSSGWRRVRTSTGKPSRRLAVRVLKALVSGALAGQESEDARWGPVRNALARGRRPRRRRLRVCDASAVLGSGRNGSGARPAGRRGGLRGPRGRDRRRALRPGPPAITVAPPNATNSSTGCSSQARLFRARRPMLRRESTGFRSSNSTPRTATV